MQVNTISFNKTGVKCRYYKYIHKLNIKWTKKLTHEAITASRSYFAFPVLFGCYWSCGPLLGITPRLKTQSELVVLAP